jgi:hypothetical protein
MLSCGREGAALIGRADLVSSGRTRLNYVAASNSHLNSSLSTTIPRTSLSTSDSEDEVYCRAEDRLREQIYFIMVIPSVL